MVESESDDGTETPQQSKYSRADDAMLGDEGSLTSEDKQEIQQLREDDGRGDNLSIARRTRSNLGDNLGGDEEEAGEYGEEDLNLDLDEGEEDDLLGDISDDSYDMQDLLSLEDDSSDDDDLDDQEDEDMGSSSDSIESDEPSGTTNSFLRRANGLREEGPSQDASQEGEEDSGSYDDEDDLGDDLNMENPYDSQDEMSFGDDADEYSDLFS